MTQIALMGEMVSKDGRYTLYVDQLQVLERSILIKATGDDGESGLFHLDARLRLDPNGHYANPAVEVTYDQFAEPEHFSIAMRAPDPNNEVCVLTIDNGEQKDIYEGELQVWRPGLQTSAQFFASANVVSQSVSGAVLPKAQPISTRSGLGTVRIAIGDVSGYPNRVPHGRGTVRDVYKGVINTQDSRFKLRVMGARFDKLTAEITMDGSWMGEGFGLTARLKFDPQLDAYDARRVRINYPDAPEHRAHCRLQWRLMEFISKNEMRFEGTWEESGETWTLSGILASMDRR